ncbi:S1 RNA binding family protein [Aneurinibacillus soli]|uniref:Uncharacterized protein n=1 Tax=Aneurinibacillus soli TaxID=1500254 RepID=A0A0U5B979_9BACL|nr:S1 RNA-binding domain-containing protein [Aneurinibacillus soli]PYE64185.1 S1 RNA binding family protein [Aneurinibacillus soli]BAU28134.1 hypothetical protein CB4_02308 [Aneurinibacillus soli]
MVRSSSEWRSRLVEEALEAMNNGERGEIKQVLEHIADTHKKTFNTVKTVFYKEIRPNIFEKDGVFIYQNDDEQVDGDIITYVESPSEVKVGDHVRVTVTDIMHYGVFAQLGTLKCLLHISNVSTGFIKEDDLPKLFKIGDVFDAYVHKVEEGHIAISTKGIDLSKKDKKTEKVVTKVTALRVVKEEKQIEHTDDKYVADIVKYLNEYFGPVSPSAKEKLQEMYKEHGPVTLSMAISEVKNAFKVDPVLLFLGEVDKKVSGCL